MAQHTPGPWRVDPEDSTGGTVLHGDDFFIADAFSSGDPNEARANARLIAAAPDLLAALKDMLVQIEYGTRFASEDLQASRAAIAKAEAV